MAEKLETQIPVYVATPLASPKPATGKRGVRAFVAGAMIGAAALWSVTCAKPGLLTPVRHVHTASASSDLHDWIGRQAAFGHRKIFDHLGPTVGAAEGLVIAAPSKEHPDYFYTWTR
ncbi:hypothetical protein FRC07_011133, partial [Ceratobasidium sp. 392]